MSKRRKGNRQRSEFTAQQQNEVQQIRVHQVLPEVEVLKINEPRPVCSICGEPIEAIIEALSEKEGSYSHFDCVLKKIRKEYNVQEPDTVSYIGSGAFAVVTKDEEGKYIIKEKIQYESNDAFASMKKFVEGTKQ